MPDLPDWYQGFQLVGSDITINVSIEASDVTLPIDIATVTADLDVTIIASDVTIDFNFADQSVAVFDAAKWFAHQAEQVFLRGAATVTSGTHSQLTSRTVPTGKTFYVIGVSALVYAAGTPDSINCDLRHAITTDISVGGHRAAVGVFDTPVRYTTGTVVSLYGVFYGGPATMLMVGVIWGYDEED